MDKFTFLNITSHDIARYWYKWHHRRKRSGNGSQPLSIHSQIRQANDTPQYTQFARLTSFLSVMLYGLGCNTIKQIAKVASCKWTNSKCNGFLAKLTALLVPFMWGVVDRIKGSWQAVRPIYQSLVGLLSICKQNRYDITIRQSTCA